MIPRDAVEADESALRVLDLRNDVASLHDGTVGECAAESAQGK